MKKKLAPLSLLGALTIFLCMPRAEARTGIGMTNLDCVVDVVPYEIFAEPPGQTTNGQQGCIVAQYSGIANPSNICFADADFLTDPENKINNVFMGILDPDCSAMLESCNEAMANAVKECPAIPFIE